MSEIDSSDFSAWTVEDDWLLKNAIESGAMLEALAKGAVRFSRQFSVKELQDRWHALLYCPEVSEVAASRMIEIELSQAVNLKQKRLNKLKSKQYFVFKKNTNSIRQHYYRKRKRIDADKVLSLDNCILSNENLAPCFADVNECLDEPATIDGKIPITNGIEIAAFPSFGLAASDVDIGDPTLNQMDIYLAPDEENAIENAFPTSSGSIADNCFNYSENTSYMLLPDSVIGVGEEGISAHNVNLIQAVSNANSENIMDSTRYPETNVLTLEQIRTALNSDNEHVLESELVFDQKDSCKDINSNLFRSEVVDQDLSAVPILPHLSSEKWAHKESVLSHSTMTDIKVDPAFQCVVSDNKIKNEALYVNDSNMLSCANVDQPCSYQPRDDNNSLHHCINMVSSYNISAEHSDAVPKSEHLEYPSITASSSVEQRSFSETSHDPENSAPKDGLMVSNISDNCPKPLYIDEPMVCIFNEQQQEVPCNDDFVPFRYQRALPLASVSTSMNVNFSSSGDVSTVKTFSSDQVSFLPVISVKEEPDSLEKIFELPSGMRLTGLSDEETNKSFMKYHHPKVEGFEHTTPVGCHDLVATSVQDLRNSSSVFSNTYSDSQTMNTHISTAVNNASKVLHENMNVTLGFRKYTHSEVAGASVHDNLNNVAVSFVDNPQTIKYDELAEDPFFQNDQLSASDEELASFSEVEEMVLGMELTDDEEEPFFDEGELTKIYKHHKRLIGRLEQTANAAMQRCLTAKGALAVLYGRYLKYFMTKHEVSIGRKTQENTVDIDLGKEGPANKVSRRQATIKLKEDGVFYLENHGRKAIFVNSYSITNGQRAYLASNCLIEIGGMRFIFEMNKKLPKKLLDNKPS